MPSLPTLPKRPWQHHVTLALALAALAVAGLMLFDQMDWLDLAATGQAKNSGWRYLLGAGSALLALTVLLMLMFGRGVSTWLAPGVALLGLGELIARKGSPLDLWVFQFMQGQSLDLPEAMPPFAALALVLGGAAMSLHLLSGPRAWRSLVVALAGSMLAAVGGATLVGHALGQQVTAGWGMAVALAPAAGAVVLTLGTLLLALAANEHADAGRGAPAWLPVPFVASAAALTVVLWAGLRERELFYLGDNARVTIADLRAAISLELQQQTGALDQLARSWGEKGLPPLAARDFDAERHLAAAPGGRTLALVRPDYITDDWFFPRAGNEALLSFDHAKDPARLLTFRLAAAGGHAVMSPVLALADSSPGFIICAPVPATREIRRRQDPARPPRIVALTANALQSDRDQSAAVGMDGFITKPVKLEEIAAAIRRLFPPVETP